tara:strand:- start:1004 stop:1252 length:249 start_codon:yes stop_codon:yes gene_type:complete
MSIKKQGEMSDELALGIRSQIEGLEEWLTGFEAWITNLQGIERDAILQDLTAEFASPIGSFLGSLETFEEGGEYRDQDEDED